MSCPSNGPVANSLTGFSLSVGSMPARARQPSRTSSLWSPLISPRFNRLMIGRKTGGHRARSPACGRSSDFVGKVRWSTGRRAALRVEHEFKYSTPCLIDAGAARRGMSRSRGRGRQRGFPARSAADLAAPGDLAGEREIGVFAQRHPTAAELRSASRPGCWLPRRPCRPGGFGFPGVVDECAWSRLFAVCETRAFRAGNLLF